jgi:DNA modification methylase
MRVKKGDTLFLLNINTDTLYGIFKAPSDGGYNLEPDAWKGKYPYQVRVTLLEELISIASATRILSKMRIKWRDSINDSKIKLLTDYIKNPSIFDWKEAKVQIEKISLMETKSGNDDKPMLESTTLWDYPSQSYGSTRKGDNSYAGVTPAFIIYNLLHRYTDPGDLVVDPMAGSGTTLDVCKEEARKCLAFDIVPVRQDIRQADARSIPLQESTVDMIFVDSPYGDNILYNNHSENIGKLSAEDVEFYDELEKVIVQCNRILKPGKVLGWLIGDQWARSSFTPVGYKVYERLSKYFDTLDIVCIVRQNQTSNTRRWHNRALQFNFYLRGFKYLFIMRKRGNDTVKTKKAEWHQYSRKRKN